jgi:palmitoyltransferase ZDHHC13/17
VPDLADEKEVPLTLLKQTRLTDAVRHGNFPLVYMLVAEGASVNQVDHDGYTSLHWAALNDFYDIASFLLKKGANVDEPSQEAETVTPLMWAALRGNIRIARLLIHWGADVNKTDARGYTPAFHAVHYDEILMLHFLRSQGGDVVDATDTKGESCLHWAAYRGLYDMCVYLLEDCKCPVDPTDSHGRAPMHWAAREGQRCVVGVLFNHGSHMLDVHDSDGKTPQNLALEKGSFILAQEIEKRKFPTYEQEHFSLLDDYNAVKMAPALQVALLPMLAFLLIGYLHPILGAVVFFMAMMIFNRFAMSWHRAAGKTPIHMFWWLGSLCVGVYVYWHDCHSWLMTNHPFLAIFYFAVFIAMMAVYAKAALQDAGRVPKDMSELRRMLEVIDRGGDVDPKSFCSTCKIRRPLRSKHCRFSGYCVSKYDHFCVWTNNAVGQNNHLYFWLYCVFHSIICLYWVVLNAVVVSFSWNSDNSFLWNVFGERPVNGFAMAYSGLVFFFTLTLWVSHLVNIGRNLTSNELANAMTYPYIHITENYQIMTPFNRGFKNNLKEFFGFSGHAVDYRNVFTTPDMDMEMGIGVATSSHGQSSSHHDDGIGIGSGEGRGGYQRLPTSPPDDEDSMLQRTRGSLPDIDVD